MNIALVEKEGITPYRDNLTKFYVGLSLISFWDTSFFCPEQVPFFVERGWLASTGHKSILRPGERQAAG